MMKVTMSLTYSE